MSPHALLSIFYPPKNLKVGGRGKGEGGGHRSFIHARIAAHSFKSLPTSLLLFPLPILPQPHAQWHKPILRFFGTGKKSEVPKSIDGLLQLQKLHVVRKHVRGVHIFVCYFVVVPADK